MTTTERIEVLEKKVAELERQLQRRHDPDGPEKAFLLAVGAIQSEDEYYALIAQRKAKNDTGLATQS